ncbi:MAG: GyrI-like domain-containing protein, partial [Candidatus Limnocylindrales bacterium]
LLWSLRLPVPADAADGEIDAALADVARKKGASTIERLRVESWTEGPSAQVLHVGPYSEEPPTIARLHEAIAARGLRPRGRHHEIYISDPNRTRPDRVKTVIRQPVEPTR